MDMSCFSRVLYLEEGNGEDNVVWVSDLKKDLLSVVVTFTTQDFTNNTPTVIHDFAAIERAVGSSLCAFKPLIKMKVSLVFMLCYCFRICTDIFTTKEKIFRGSIRCLWFFLLQNSKKNPHFGKSFFPYFSFSMKVFVKSSNI